MDRLNCRNAQFPIGSNSEYFAAMNSYLQLAEAVLKRTSQPLSASEILDAGYRLQLVPEHLFGKTQHKTLQARLAEDLLRNRASTVFARTGPGRFVLRKDLDFNEEAYQEYIAPLRSYQLKQFDVICADKAELQGVWRKQGEYVPLQSVVRAFKKQIPLLEAERSLELVHLRLLVTIKCLDRVLTINSQHDPSYGAGRSLGFFGYLKGVDIDLFSRDRFGLQQASFRTLEEQTGLNQQALEQLTEAIEFDAINCLKVMDNAQAKNSIAVLTAYECDEPEKFISHVPSHRSPRWARIPSEINDVGSLEPLSKQLFSNRDLVDAIFL